MPRVNQKDAGIYLLPFCQALGHATLLRTTGNGIHTMMLQHATAMILSQNMLRLRIHQVKLLDINLQVQPCLTKTFNRKLVRKTQNSLMLKV